MASAQIIGGTHNANGFLWDMGNTVYQGSLRGIGGNSLEGQVASVQIVSEAQKKSFLKATATGLAGAAIAGPVGAVVGIVAGGNRKEVLFSCQLHHGGQLIARGDIGIFELLLAESMKPQRKAAPVPVIPRGLSLVQSGDFPQGCSVVIDKGMVYLYNRGQTPFLMSGKVTSLEEEVSVETKITSGLLKSSPSVRFHCRFRDGRELTAQGDAIIYETLRGQPFKLGKAVRAWVFGFLLLLAFGLALYFQTSVTEFISPSR